MQGVQSSRERPNAIGDCRDQNWRACSLRPGCGSQQSGSVRPIIIAAFGLSASRAAVGFAAQLPLAAAGAAAPPDAPTAIACTARVGGSSE